MNEMNFQTIKKRKDKKLLKLIEQTQREKEEYDEVDKRIRKSRTDPTERRGRNWQGICSNDDNQNETFRYFVQPNQQEETEESRKQSKQTQKREQQFENIRQKSIQINSLIQLEQRDGTQRQEFIARTGLIHLVDPEEMCQLCTEADFIKIKMLGKGSNGLVEKQLFRPLNQEVAKKQYLKENQSEEFESEVYIMNSKPSEFVPKLIFFNKTKLSIFMELGMLTLENFDNYLCSNNQPFQAQWASWILTSLLEINLAMFQNNYHHGDIKPSNIIFSFDLSQRLQIKLIDFGGASVFCEDYWIQYTPQFQCPQLIACLCSSEDIVLSKEQIFYAEFFASCRSVQLLTLANNPLRTELFRLSSIPQYLEDFQIRYQYPLFHTIFHYIYNKLNKTLTKGDVDFLFIILDKQHLLDNSEVLANKVETAFQENNKQT